MKFPSAGWPPLGDLEKIRSVHKAIRLLGMVGVAEIVVPTQAHVEHLRLTYGLTATGPPIVYRGWATGRPPYPPDSLSIDGLIIRAAKEGDWCTLPVEIPPTGV